VLSGYDAAVSTLTPQTLPTAPSAVTASTRTISSITWTWADNAFNETGYRVKASSDNSNLSGDLAANTTQWVQVGLGVNTSQQIYVEAFNTVGGAGSGNTVKTYTLALAPVGTAMTGVYSSSVTFVWSGNGNPAGTVYRGERSTDGVTYAQFYSGTSLGGTALGLASQATYYFRVRAQNGNGIATDYDAVLSTLTLPAPLQPATNLQVSTRSASSLTWIWIDNDNTENGYRVRSSEDDSDLSGSLPADTTQWIQTGLNGNSTHQVYVEIYSPLGVANSGDSGLNYTLANAPSGTALAGVFVTSVSLSWSAGNNTASTLYQAEKSTNNALFSQFFFGTETGTYATSLNYETTYYFRVRAQNNAGIWTAYDTVVTTLTLPVPPAAATGLTVSTRTTTSLVWTWTDNAYNELGYRVRMSSSGDNLSGDLAPDTTQWTQSGLGVNTSQQVYVQAFTSVYSVDSIGAIPYFTLANPPTGTSVSDVLVTSAVLTWSAGGNPAGTVYKAEKSTDNAQFAQFYVGTFSSTSVTGLSADTSYWFRVRASNGDGIATGADAVVSTKTLPTPPAAASGVTVSTRTTSSLTWTWTDNSNNEQGFRVLASSDSSNLSGDLPPETTVWVQSGIEVNTTRQIYVQVFNTGGTANSANVLRYTLANPPSASQITGVFTSSITVSWSENGNSIGTNYRAERSTDGAQFIQFYFGSSSSATATSLFAESTYYFRVKAQNGDGILTVYDAVVSTRTQPSIPAAASNLQASTRTTSAIVWTWTDNAVNETSYQVICSSDGTDLSGLLPQNTTSWTQTGLGVNTYQNVTIRVANYSGSADSSDSGSIFTLANAPTNSALSQVFGTSVTLSWSANGNPAGPSGTTYRAEKSTDNVNFSQFYLGTAVSARASGLLPDTSYWFRVQAQNKNAIVTDYDAVQTTRTLDGKDTPWTSATAATTKDRSSNSNTGTLTNMSQATSTVIGKIGQGLTCNGTSQYVLLSKAVPAVSSGGAMSASLWMKGTDSYGGLFSLRSSVSSSPIFDISVGYDGSVDTSGKIRAITRYDSNLGLLSIGGTKSVNDGLWHHIVLVLDQANNYFRIYVDGVQTDNGTQSVDGAITTTANQSSMCAEKNWIDTSYTTAGNRYYAGNVDEVRVYNRALSASEVTQLYKQGVSTSR
jgi:uncharacterized protein YegP (UPF0339 family)